MANNSLLCLCSPLCSVVLLLLIASLPDGSISCHYGKFRDHKNVYEHYEIYTVPQEKPFYEYTPYTGYEDISHCQVLFKSIFPKQQVKITFEEVDVDWPLKDGDFSTCPDKLVLYDGNTTRAPVLETFCGAETPTVQSTKNFILLEFTRDIVYSSKRGGFSLTYQIMEKPPSSSKSFNIAWTAIAIPVLAVLYYFARSACMKCNSTAYDYEPQQMEEVDRNANADPEANQFRNSATAGQNGQGTSSHYNTQSWGEGDEYTSVTASAPSYEDVVQPGQYKPSPLPPPPSYEEAASGKYDPK